MGNEPPRQPSSIKFYAGNQNRETEPRFKLTIPGAFKSCARSASPSTATHALGRGGHAHFEEQAPFLRYSGAPCFSAEITRRRTGSEQQIGDLLPRRFRRGDPPWNP